MSSQGRTTWNKRQKEQARQQKARDKAQRRLERKSEKQEHGSGSSSLDDLIAFDEPNPLAPPPPNSNEPGD